MKRISLGMLLLVAAVLAPAHAQTKGSERPSHIPTQQEKDGPFGTQWAKPPGTTGSQIYNDPRTRDPNSPYSSQRSKPCPAPSISDPASGGCR